jgi:hypothetical protein
MAYMPLSLATCTSCSSPLGKSRDQGPHVMNHKKISGAYVQPESQNASEKREADELQAARETILYPRSLFLVRLCLVNCWHLWSSIGRRESYLFSPPRLRLACPLLNGDLPDSSALNRTSSVRDTPTDAQRLNSNRKGDRQPD